jgi:hypothetical protein
LTVECVRLRDGEKFKPFELKLQKVTVKTLKDKFGRDEQDQMAVIPGGTLEAKVRAENKAEKQHDFMERVLAVHLGNQATFTDWFAEMVKVMPLKVDKDGKAKPGISETTFRRWLKAIGARGHVVLPAGEDLTSQGYLYEVVAGPWAIQPGTAASGMAESTAVNNRHSTLYRESGINGGGFGEDGHRHGPPKDSQMESGGGSSDGRVNGQDSPPAGSPGSVSDLIGQARDQLPDDGKPPKLH